MNGDILFLAHRLPYPPDRGDRIRSWHVLNALARIAPVHVCALIDDEADRAHVQAVKSVAASVTVVARRKSKVLPIFRALAKGGSASVSAFYDPRLDAAVRPRLPHVSVIYAFSSQMAAYVPQNFPGRFVMDFVDMDSAKFAAMGFAGRQEAKRLFAWERATAERADASIFVTDAEATLFRDQTGLPVLVVGNGVDLDAFAPDVVAPADVDGPVIVFTGQMDYPPNVEAVTTFALQVLPQIRGQCGDVRFAIVGRAPTDEVRSLASDAVIVSGQVADVRPWLAAASVAVAPLRVARGVQNKLLEAMAMGRACVASRAAAEGLDAVDGRDLIITDNPGPAVAALLTNPARAAQIGRAARRCVETCYTWDSRLSPLAAIVTG